MVEIKTTSGFALEFDKARLDNMELVDAMADMTTGNTLAISHVCRLMLGDADRKRLYDHLRGENGAVPVGKVSEELMEIVRAIGDLGKN